MRPRPRRPDLPAPASGRWRAPTAPSPARSSRRDTASAWPLPARVRPRRRGPSDFLHPLGCVHHELDHRRGRPFTVLVANHGHSFSPRALDDVVLEVTDVGEALEVLVERPLAVRGDVADPEVARV